MFEFGKKKEKMTSVCTHDEDNKNVVTSVKVLGSGCKSCHALLENTQTALKSMNIDIKAEYITDMKEVAACGVMSTPAIAVNEQVISMGRVLSAADVEKLLRKFG